MRLKDIKEELEKIIFIDREGNTCIDKQGLFRLYDKICKEIWDELKKEEILE